MKKYAIFLLTFVTFCSQNSNIEVLEEETTTTVAPIVETPLEAFPLSVSYRVLLTTKPLVLKHCACNL